MPPEFKRILYGAALWGLKHPIGLEDINPVFSQARQIFDEAGFSGKQCSVEMFAESEPAVDERYAHVVKDAAHAYNLAPITMIFRPKASNSKSMVSHNRKSRRAAVVQCNRGIDFAVLATPASLPTLVNGPFELVHGAGSSEVIGAQRKMYLISSLSMVADKLEATGAYAALEPLRQSETKMPVSADFWLEMLDKVGSHRLGILFDTVHFYEGNERSPLKMLKALDTVCQAGRCFGVHLSNSPSRVEWGPSGIAKYTPEILEVLRKYNCNVTVDYEGFDNCLDGLVGITRRPDQKNQEEVFARSMKYLASQIN
jgi:sugar phosphate isomerase/epimerase